VNFILAHLNFYLKQNQEKEKSLRDVMFVLGPGHAYPALAANLFMERVMTEFFGDDKFSKRKFAKNIYDFQLIATS
jgi:phosphoketolase